MQPALRRPRRLRIPPWLLKGAVLAIAWTSLSVQFQLWQVQKHENRSESLVREVSITHRRQDAENALREFIPNQTVWKESRALPTWMKNYFQWHSEQMALYRRHSQNFNASATNNSTLPPKFLVVRCLETDTKCGGTADRLAPLPFLVMLAARLQRILLIHWERPAALQEFLEPVSIDWRVPETLLQSTLWKKTPRLTVVEDILSLLDPNFREPTNQRRRRKRLPKVLPSVVTILFQSNDHGATMYNDFKDQTNLFLKNDSVANSNSDSERQPTFQQVYSECWRSLFQPTAPIQSRIDAALQKLQLVPRQYVAVHIRGLYQKAAGPKRTAFVARNAMHCASQLRVSAHEAIYVTTDSFNSTQAALEYAHQNHPETRVVARSIEQQQQQRTAPVLHLDRGTAFLSKNASAWTAQTNGAASSFYDTFVDLYLLALARCRSVHLGNYAKWAHLISDDNKDCFNNHLSRMCPWKDVK